jgi:hypothetical protein
MEMVEEVASTIKPAPADQRTSSEKTRCAERTDEIEERMELDPPSTQVKE